MSKKPHSMLDGPKPDLGLSTIAPPVDDKISIIVVTHDRPEYLNICLQTIAVNSSNNNYEVIVVDSGSTRADAINYLQDLEETHQCKVVRKKENVFWAAAANAGAKAADKDSRYLVFCHEDLAVLNPSIWDYFINISDGERSGLVGLSRHGYSMDNQRFEFIEEWCCLVTRECWNDCGPFEESLPIIGAPFLFSLAVHHAGHRPIALANDQMKLAHHFSNFSIPINEFERESFNAMEKLPKLIAQTQQRVSAIQAKKAAGR